MGDNISELFFIPVVQEYLNEIAPTLNGPNKLKTSGKPQRIADLQPPASGQDKPDTLSVDVTLHWLHWVPHKKVTRDSRLQDNMQTITNYDYESLCGPSFEALKSRL